MSIIELLRRYETFIRYVIIGVATTAINMLVFFILEHLGMNYMLANTIAWLVSVIFAFFTNKQLVFKSAYTSKRDFTRELVSFFVLRLVSLGFDDGLMYLGITILGFGTAPVKVVSQIVVIIANYIFSKIIFTQPKER